MNKIYTIYVVALNDEGTKKSTRVGRKGNVYELGDRVWGWFDDFEKSEKVVLNNVTDIFEYYYNYACVEEVPQGVIAIAKVIQWYKASFDSDRGVVSVVKVDPPPFAKNTVNFTMG